MRSENGVTHGRRPLRLGLLLLRRRVLLRARGRPIRLPVLAFPLNALLDLLAMHGDTFRRLDSYPHLIALDAEDGDGDLVADHQRLPDSPGQYEHGLTSSSMLTVHPLSRADGAGPADAQPFRRVRTQSVTEPSAASSAAGLLPPACAKSARPPPRPPTWAAIAPANSPAFKRAH